MKQRKTSDVKINALWSAKYSYVAVASCCNVETIFELSAQKLHILISTGLYVYKCRLEYYNSLQHALTVVQAVKKLLALSETTSFNTTFTVGRVHSRLHPISTAITLFSSHVCLNVTSRHVAFTCVGFELTTVCLSVLQLDFL